MKQPANHCQIYLIAPPGIGGEVLTRFAANGGLAPAACVLLGAGADGRADRALARSLLALTHDAGIPLVLESDIAAAAELTADGVHIAAEEEAYAQAREALGDEAIVGVDCGLSRHAAMTLADLGADYVAFSGEGEALEETIAWWSEVTVIPCVAWDAADQDAALALAGAGADFVAVGGFVWSDDAGAADAMRKLAERLAMNPVAA